MSTRTMKRKVETAFAVDYLPAKLANQGLHIYQGHEPPEDEEQYPCLIVYAENASAHPDMPTETGTLLVDLRLQIRFDSAEAGRALMDSILGDIEDAMRCVSDIKRILNRPTTGIDTRQAKGIHFHDATPAEQPSETSETDWVEEMRFQILCEPLSY